jgi:putative DNA primase/helicase
VLAAAQQCGLSDREAERTYDSGFKSGLQNPAEKKDRRGNVIPLDARSDRSDSLDDDGITADCTDLFSAETYIKYHGADTRYCDPLGKFLLWDGQRWARDKTGETESRMLKVARAELEIAAKRYKKLSAEFADVSADPNADTDVLQKIKAKIKGESSKLAWWKKSQNQNRYSSAVKTISIMREIATTEDQYDANQMLLNVANGTINLHDSTLRPHDRNDLITRLAPVTYDPKAEAPLWQAFLRRIFAENDEIISSIKRLLGYGLTGSAREEILPIFYGTGANGKSTLSKSIAGIMGDYYKSIDSEILLDQKNQSNKVDSEKAQLRGVRLATCAEPSAGRSLSDGLLKQIASRDRVVARFLRCDTITFEPTHKIILITNHRPRIPTSDLGTRRRLLLVPYTITIPEDERDKSLDDKLATEASGILNWLIEGCREWQRIGLAPCPEIMAATNEYLADEDTLGAFIAESCIDEPGSREDSSSLYKSYEKWCLDAGEKPRSQNAFGRSLNERGYRRVKSRGRKMYVGIRLRGTPYQSEMVS